MAVTTLLEAIMQTARAAMVALRFRLETLCLFAGSFCVDACNWSGSQDAANRNEVVSQYAAELKAWDKDGDGRLSRKEAAAMVDQFIAIEAIRSRGALTHANLERQRNQLLADFAKQDRDHDGYVTLADLLKRPLAAFDCMDTNHDGKLSQSEIDAGAKRCAAFDDSSQRNHF